MKTPVLVATLLALAASPAWAEVTRLRIERREVILNGKAWGAAGPYEKLVGKVDFALDPRLPQNQIIVDLALAPRNAQGLVEFSADFYLIKPVDPGRGNGRLFYEAGNRGTMRILQTFQQASNASDPKTEAEFGNGALMNQGFTLLWMGWQWDVPQGRMRMEIPIATHNGQPITGLVRGNFIPGKGATTASIADRGHQPYPVIDPASAEHRMVVRTVPTDPPAEIPRSRWRFTAPGTVTLDGGFEAGLIYDVIYRARDPRVVGVGLAGTRDIVSFFKHADAAQGNPMPGITLALGWGVSQTGRFLRHFVYQGFNQDERGRQVFDGLIDQVGGAGRGSFNHRFGQQSRDQLQHFNILYPVDMFPFTDEDETDPETGTTDGLLARARRSNTVPKFFHVLTDSEYFNRAGSLTHTDVAGTRDIEPPATSRIYVIASAPHIVGPFPPAPYADPDFIGQADGNPLVYAPVIRALFRALDQWVTDGREPPASRYPRLSDGTLTTVEASGWPNIPRFTRPTHPMTTYRLDFGPDWSKGIVTIEPPKIGKPFVGRVPAVDEAGNDRAGIRLPEIAVPLATHTGWNYRHPSIGNPERLASEIGSYLPLPRTKADRERTQDGRKSIEERYASKEDYLGRISLAALALVDERYLLAEDIPDVTRRAAAHYDWATRSGGTAPMLMLQATALVVPRGTPVVIDGRLDDREWQGSLTRPLTAGADVRLRHDGRHLFVGITSSQPGFASACIARADAVRIFHASAALGSVGYLRHERDWTTRDLAFEYGMRNTELTEAARAERHQYLNRHAWLASTFRMGGGVAQEMQFTLERDVTTLTMALAFFVPTGETGSIVSWPQTLSDGDGCRDEQLVRGHVPPQLRFSPERWATLTLER